jgi:hypothetical protein
VEFDLPLVLDHERASMVLWALLRPEVFQVHREPPDDLLGEIVGASEEEGVRVCSGLRTGVVIGIEQMLTALVSEADRRGRRVELAELHGEALTAVYRMLFLLFAEARMLLPSWHPVYRRAYSLEALRRRVERGTPLPGIWEAVQAIGRLAHAGCRAGDLVVTPFNGRLFSPARAPRLDRARLGDDPVSGALLAVSTVGRARGPGRQRIAFGDLGVEELGAVYEGLLEYEPRVLPAPMASGGRGRRTPAIARLERTGTAYRKATGTFYTPRAVTRYLAGQTLHPLVTGRSSSTLLQLRICDPAMGSGAFLVAACHVLAEAYESALVREGECSAGSLNEQDRAGFRRLVAQRCLFGVDLNPMAVQLARLSLWLTTLAADQPLTFLDHHLVTGNSLLGAGPLDLLRHTVIGPRGPVEDRQLPLFDAAALAAVVGTVLPVRRHLECTADSTAAIVREKERALGAIEGSPDVLRWQTACDVWCANWCGGRPHRPATLRALVDSALRDLPGLPERAAEQQLRAARERSAIHAFHHWPLRFPEVFFDDQGTARADAGFDAIIGNPPWEMLRADRGSQARETLSAVLNFAKQSGLFTSRPSGHANQYQLFLDRALALVRRGGRIGLVVPGGLTTDASAAELRRRLLVECDVDGLVGFENRAGVFPIHRSTRFLLLTATRGGPTGEVRCRFGLERPADLDELTLDLATDPGRAFPVRAPLGLLRRISDDLAIPYVRTARDLQITEHIASAHPALASAAGWGVTFGRELNATDHRRHFNASRRGLPVLEGKHVLPFKVRLEDTSLWIDEARAGQLLGRSGGFTRARLAFRDVSSAGNRQTLIAAVLPAGCVTTHTLFCLRTRLPPPDQRVLCALLNSHVADFLVRQRVTTHVTLAVMQRLPVPRPDPECSLFQALEQRARRLESPSGDADDAAEAQALAALAYGLSAGEFEHALSTFPLVPIAARQAALAAFRRRARR